MKQPDMVTRSSNIGDNVSSLSEVFGRCFRAALVPERAPDMDGVGRLGANFESGKGTRSLVGGLKVGRGLRGWDRDLEAHIDFGGDPYT